MSLSPEMTAGQKNQDTHDVHEALTATTARQLQPVFELLLSQVGKEKAEAVLHDALMRCLAPVAESTEPTPAMPKKTRLDELPLWMYWYARFPRYVDAAFIATIVGILGTALCGWYGLAPVWVGYLVGCLSTAALLALALAVNQDA